MTTATPQVQVLEIDSHQWMNLVCALIEDAEFCKDLIEDYLNGLSEKDLDACYTRNFPDQPSLIRDALPEELN